MKDNRRSFFKTLTGGMLVTGLFAANPIKSISKAISKDEKKFEVKIHPSAIKRNARGEK